MKRGTLLFPNEYMVANGDCSPALVLEVIRRRGRLTDDYRILFSRSGGFVNVVGSESISNLYWWEE